MLCWIPSYSHTYYLVTVMSFSGPSLTLPFCHTLVQSSQSCHQTVPGEGSQRSQGSLDQERKWKQYLEDERIALFLQNEEFMKELQRNRDFLLALERGDKPFQRLMCMLFICLNSSFAATSSPWASFSIALHWVSLFTQIQNECKMQLHHNGNVFHPRCTYAALV